MSRESIESVEMFQSVSPQHVAFRERRAVTLGSEEGLGFSTPVDSDLVPPPSPLYYKRHSLISPRSSPKSTQGCHQADSLGSFSSLHKYCSSLSIGSYINLQNSPESIPEFAIPSRKTPPRSARLTSTGELVHYIKRNSSRDYHALIREEMIQDELQRSMSASCVNADRQSEDVKMGSVNDIDEATG